LVLAGVLLAILVLRETGHLSLDLYASRSAARTGNQVSTERTAVNDSPEVDLTQAALTIGVTTTIETIAARTAADALRNMQLPGAGPCQGRLTVDLQRVDLDGSHWVPLHKQGGCDFAASYKLKAEGGGSSVVMDGQVHGRVDCTVTGACSAYKFRQIMGQQVAGEIEKQIRSQLISK